MSNIAEYIIDVMPAVETNIDIVVDGIKFRGKTLSEWDDIVSYPGLHENPTPVEAQRFNIKYIEVNEIIMRNLAIARASFTLASSTYQTKLKAKQKEIVDKIITDNKKVPGMESVEKMAMIRCSSEFHAMKISELFLDFWKTYHDKMYLLDSRLSSINYLIRN